MAVSDELRKQIMAQHQGAQRLYLAFIGVHNGLFDTLAQGGPLTAPALAERAAVDTAYVVRWCDAAYAYELLDEKGGAFSLTELGDAFRPDTPGTLMPMAVGSILTAHMAERAAGLMKTGERPGEVILGERASVLPWFGPMLEKSFGNMFEQHVLPNIPVFQKVDARGGLAIDLGCGNGWYARRLAKRFAKLKAIGLDGFDENIRQATALAQKDGVGDRVRFETGDIYKFHISERADLIAMNRAMHHVWDEKDIVFGILKEHLKPGGYAVIWEPSWPTDRSALRDPSRRAMSFQNLGEHMQGNHLLHPAEIEAAFKDVGMEAKTYTFLNGNEAVVVGKRV